jgi:hypothetical protein
MNSQWFQQNIFIVVRTLRVRNAYSLTGRFASPVSLILLMKIALPALEYSARSACGSPMR